MTGNPQTQTFTYDSLNRLTSAQATGGTIGNYAQQSYTYDANTGNLASKAGVNYGYNDASHTHAVTHLGGVQKYWYDANGNQTKRIIGADTYDLAYDAENRLVEVKKNSSVYATFVYNADGQRVKGSVNGVSIAYVGSYAEWTSSALTSYYYAGAAQIAMRQAGELIYMFGDHLGSTSKTYKASNGETRMQLYTPWGERRYPTATSEISTRYRYTGQYEYSELGLYFYQSRWYDASLGRFAQADSIIPNPGDSQSWDRYAYVRNNPLNFIDPSGFTSVCAYGNGDPECDPSYQDSWHPLLIQYGVKTEGDWTNKDKQAMLRDVSTLANALSSTCGEECYGIPPHILFEMLFGKRIIKLLNDGKSLGCLLLNCSEGTRGTLSNPAQLGLIIHEFAHILDHMISWGYVRTLLSHTTIRNNLGEHVTGAVTPGLSNFLRTILGYKSATHPDMQHPMKDEAGYGSGEDWADMIMNWAQNSFDYSEQAYGAGYARYQWVNATVTNLVKILLSR